MVRCRTCTAREGYDVCSPGGSRGRCSTRSSASTGSWGMRWLSRCGAEGDADDGGRAPRQFAEQVQSGSGVGSDVDLTSQEMVLPWVGGRDRDADPEKLLTIRRVDAEVWGFCRVYRSAGVAIPGATAPLQIPGLAIPGVALPPPPASTLPIPGLPGTQATPANPKAPPIPTVTVPTIADRD